ncbi:MAG: adenylate kinase [Bacteroidota bacterium]
MPRILIIGCSGSGKSTLAKQIASACRLPYINTDALYWNSDWSVVPTETVLAAIDFEAENYVLDGNFASSREQVWRAVDIIVWLDYGLPLVLYRLFFRNMRWWLSDASPWTGKRMSFRRACAGLWHGFRSHGKKRTAYPGYLMDFPDKEIHRISSKKERTLLLNALSTRFGF